MNPLPPALPRAMLRALLPADIRRQVIGDLDEEFAQRARAGSTRARAWYWRQAIASLPYAWPLRRRSRRLRRTGQRADVPRRRLIGDAVRDVRHGFRLLRQQPLLAASVTVTMALGIGASTSVLTMAHAVLLRGLPYDQADRLVSVAEVDTRNESAGENMSWPDFLDYRSRTRTLSGLAGFNGGSRTLLGVGPPDRVAMTEVTEGFFALLGVQPALGRDFVHADFLDGAPLAMLLTDRSWRLRFGADAGVIGRRVDLGGQTATIAGVLPASFEFPLRGLTEIWLPLRTNPAQRERRYFHWLRAIGRLDAEVTAEQAEAELRTIAAGFAAVDPTWHPAASVRLSSLNDRITGRLRPAALVLAGAAVLLLAGACASLAGVLVARGLGRVHEIGVRTAIGASPGRVIRQLLAESTAMALPGALAGLVAGVVTLRAFIAMLPLQQRVSLPHLETVGLDPAMLAASGGLALLVVVASGLLPAWRASRQGSTVGVVRAPTASPREARAQTLLVAGQIALTLVLMTGAALLGRSLHRLLDVSPGFDPAGLLTFRINLTPARSPTPEATRAFHAEVLRRLAQLPGTRGVASIDQLPLTGPGNSGTLTIAGETQGAQREVLVRSVSNRYFDLLGLTVTQGRPFGPTDGPTSPRVVVVNRLLADTIFGGDAVGQRIAFPFFDGQPWWEIIGVVGNEQFDALDRAMQPVVYFAYAQTTGGAFSVVLRADGDPALMEPRVRAAVAEVDASTPVFLVRPLTRFVEESDAVFRRRTALTVIAGFALAALALAAVGVYGAVALMVTRRTREIGIRQALGATRGQVLAGMLARGLAPTAIGIGLGVGASLAVAPSLRSLVFGIGAMDGLSLAGAVVFLFVVAVTAAFVPARRVLRIDPVRALRE